MIWVKTVLDLLMINSGFNIHSLPLELQTQLHNKGIAISKVNARSARPFHQYRDPFVHV